MDGLERKAYLPIIAVPSSLLATGLGLASLICKPEVLLSAATVLATASSGISGKLIG